MRKLAFIKDEIRNKKLREYLDENFTVLQTKNFVSVVDSLNNSIVLKHSFRNEYLTISVAQDNRILLISESFGGGNIRKLESSQIKKL